MLRCSPAQRATGSLSATAASNASGSIRADGARDSAWFLCSQVQDQKCMVTDTKSPGEKLSVTSKTTLTLKPRAETGVVRQSFSHGRSKAVVVEKVSKSTLGPGAGTTGVHR